MRAPKPQRAPTGRPPLIKGPQTLVGVPMGADLLAWLDDYRRLQPDLPSRAVMVRRLLNGMRQG